LPHTSRPITARVAQNAGPAILVAVFWLTIALAGVAAAAFPLSPGASLTALTAAILVAPFAVRRFRGVSTDVFDPLIVFAVAYGVMFVLRPGYMLLTHTDYYVLAGVSVDISETFRQMQVLGVLGAAAFVVGYEAGFGVDRVPQWRTPAEPSSAGVAAAATVVAAVGAAATVAFLASIGGPQVLFAGRSEAYFEVLGGASKYLYYAPTLLIGAGLLYLVAWVKDRKGIYLVGFAASSLLLLMVRAPVGSRLALFPLLAAPVLLLYLARGRRPRAWSVTVVAMIAVVASSVVLNSRTQNAREEGGIATAVRTVIADPLRAFAPLTEGQDAAIAPALAAALTVVPTEIGHTYGGATAGDLLSRAVPRAVWPEKPKPPRERVVEALFGKAYAQGLANPEFSLLFAWFLDWGWIGMLALVPLGAAVRLAAEYGFHNSRNTLVMALFASSWPMFAASLRDTPVDSAVRAAFVVAPVAAVAMFHMTRRQRTQPSPAHQPHGRASARHDT